MLDGADARTQALGAGPGWAAAFTIFAPENPVEGRRVLFVERDSGLVRAMARRPRMSNLVVPP